LLNACAKAACGLGLLLMAGWTQAGSAAASNFCDRQDKLSAGEQDRLLRFAAVVRTELGRGDGTGHGNVALVSRSGLDLSRFAIRYSHAALALKDAGGTWSARQLYFACDEKRPRIFDQGIAGFAMGTDDPAVGYIAIVRLPGAAATELDLAARDRQRALHLLAGKYSANAYPWSLRYQNCNQWVIEMLGSAWGGLADGPDLRTRAQDWLRGAGYAPEPVAVASPFTMMASYAVPLVHLDDHPAADRAARRLQVSLPSTVEAFVRHRFPASERVELCHNDREIVIHQGWTPVAAGCVAGPGDRIVALD
jgi:hypothetical protein